MNGKSFVRTIVVLVVLSGMMWFVFRSVDIAQLWSLLKHTSWGILVATIPIILLSHVLRAYRWSQLLKESKNTPSLGLLFSSVMIGYAANTIIPRSGEVLRPFVASRRSTLPFATALSSVVVERIIDVLTLVFGIGLLIVLRPDTIRAVLPDVTPSTIILTFAIPAVALGVVLSLIVFTHLGEVATSRWLRPLHEGAAASVTKALANVKVGAAALRTPRQWLSIIMSSILMWALYAAPMYLVLESIPWSQAHAFSLADGAILLVVTAVAVTIAPTPGAVGVYQGFAQVAIMALYDGTPTEGIAFGMIAWILNYGLAVLVGGVCAAYEVRQGLTWKDLRSTSTESSAS